VDVLPGMHAARFRFYAELNDFLPPARRARETAYSFRGTPSIKDAIEAQGVPHTEVDLVLVNGGSVDFQHLLRDGDRVSVYPVFEGLDITPAVRLRPRPLRISRFVLDGHLGKLARWLRLLGFDTLYHNDAEDADIIHTALREGRIILTRDLGLLRVRDVTHGYWVRSSDPAEQLREVVARLELGTQVRPFTRCMICNGLIQPAAKEQVWEWLAPRTRAHYDEFHTCVGCGRIYWKGRHYEALRAVLGALLEGAGESEG
jgi:uncharacterized protein with PIN domain